MKKRFLLHDLEEQDIATIIGTPADNLLILSAKPEVKHCVGCFGCWVKTPGKCVISDRSTVSPTWLAASHEMIILSRLVYGGFSPSVKAVLDRSIGYLLPYFRMLNNEMHHVMRYQNPFKLVVHFYGRQMTSSERELAPQLITANAINLGAGSSQVFFHESIQEMEGVI